MFDPFHAQQPLKPLQAVSSPSYSSSHGEQLHPILMCILTSKFHGWRKCFSFTPTTSQMGTCQQEQRPGTKRPIQLRKSFVSSSYALADPPWNPTVDLTTSSAANTYHSSYLVSSSARAKRRCFPGSALRPVSVLLFRPSASPVAHQRQCGRCERQLARLD